MVIQENASSHFLYNSFDVRKNGTQVKNLGPIFTYIILEKTIACAS